MALGNELRPFGITVCAVMPGDIHTGFTAARHKVGQGDEIYAGRISRSVKRMEHDEQTGMDPAKAGAFVGKVALKTSHKPLCRRNANSHSGERTGTFVYGDQVNIIKRSI